jgi:hypothetical protein
MVVRGVSTIPDVYFDTGSFVAQPFPSWAAQSLEWLGEGEVTTLDKEESASDTTLGGAFFGPIVDNYVGFDWESPPEGLVFLDVFKVKPSGIIWYVDTLFDATTGEFFEETSGDVTVAAGYLIFRPNDQL